VIAATGYRRGLESLVSYLGVLDEKGTPAGHRWPPHRSVPTIPSLTIPPLTLRSPQAQPKPKKCKKLKHGKCVKKHKRKKKPKR
jgi:hypothetical protein